MSQPNSTEFEMINLRTVMAQEGITDRIISGLFVQAADGCVTDCNSAVLGMLGVQRSDFIGRRPFDPPWVAVRQDGSTCTPEQLPGMTVLQTGQGSLGHVIGIDVVGVDGQKRRRVWLRMGAQPFEVNGKILGSVTLVEDVTESWNEHFALELLSAIGRVVISSKTTAECMQGLCNTLVTVGHFALAWIGESSDRNFGQIDVLASSGSTSYLDNQEYSWLGSSDLGRGPMGTTVRTQNSHFVNDMQNQTLMAPWHDQAVSFGMNSAAAIPIQIEGKKAALGLLETHATAFDDAKMASLEFVVREVEFGIAHVESIQKMKASLDGTIWAMSQLNELRNPFLNGRNKNVADLSAAIAKKMEFDEERVRLIRMSAELADIGTITVPLEILLRSGSLTDLETALFEVHAVAGANILRRANLPWPVAEVALQHHERFDGSGYPRGLLGTEVSLPSRIVAVAETVESQCRPGPTGIAASIDMVLSRVKENSGTKFDSEVVNACLSIFAEGFEFRADEKVV